MTTRETTLGQLLQEKRGDRSKRSVYIQLGVSSQTYDAWESDLYTPGDEFAQRLAAYLEMDERDIVWMLYQARLKKGLNETPIIHGMSWADRPTDNRPPLRRVA